MATLRIVLDQVITPGWDGSGPYALELTRELIGTAPDGVGVEGMVGASTAAQYEQIATSFPGLADLQKSAFSYETLRVFARHGLAAPRDGMVHSPGLLAPLSRTRRTSASGAQTVVTVHDSLAWTSPALLPRGVAEWRTAMLKRAERFADAVVVPNHAVADDLAATGSFGERIRVIPGGVSPALSIAEGSSAHTPALDLPERYLLAWSDGVVHRTLLPLLRALDRTDGPKVPLVVVGPEEVNAVVAESRIDPARVQIVDPGRTMECAAALANAEALVHPGPAVGFSLELINALSAGVPVVHIDDAALEELTAGAALVVPRSAVSGFTASLAQHLDALLDDRQTLERLRVTGQDRARHFSWRDSAEKIWQLHADL